MLSPRRCIAATFVALAHASVARADDAALATSTPKEVEPSHLYTPPPAPYSLPWQLRSVIPANLVRSDTSIAFMKNPSAPDGNGNSGSTIATTLLASYKVMPDLAPFVRLAYVKNHPTDGDDSSVFANPAVGATYGLKFGDMRLGLMLAAAIPVGQGGGNRPAASDAGFKDYVARRGALRDGIRARSSMDNALFAVNFLTIFPGVGLAYVSGGLTVQVEATILILRRVRGDDAADDSAKTNLTTGLHVGYFLIKEVSVGAEIRHQRWLNTPSDVTADQALPADKQLGVRDQTTWALGVRAHFKLGESMWLRPGVSYSMALDDPMARLGYKVVQIDVPFVF